MNARSIRPCREAARRWAATPPPFICGEAVPVIRGGAAPFVRRAAALVIAAAALASARARAEDPATNAPAPRVVACVGDSITWGGGGKNAYPSLLQAELGEGWEVRNFGVNSRTARREGKEFDLRPGDLDYRKTLSYTKSLSCKPDAVILMIGTNDSKPPNWEETGDAFREGYADLVEGYLALDPRPVVVIGISPTVKGGGFTYGVTEKIVGGGVVPVQRRIAEEKGLPTVDCRAVLDPHMATAYSGDGLHPNAEGNALLAAAFAARLRELFSHAEGAEIESHAENAESAEPVLPGGFGGGGASSR